MAIDADRSRAHRDRELTLTEENRTSHAMIAAAQDDVASFLDAVRPAVDARLAELLARLRAEAIEAGAVPSIVADAYAQLCLRGGKRLRAALVVAAHRACASERGASSNAIDDAVLDVACAWELLQGYFLVHDDWMDGDDTRRGAPTVHRVLSERLGRDAYAILAGDLGAAFAHRVLVEAAAPAEATVAIARAFASVHVDVVLGQCVDLAGTDEPEAIESMYAMKSASYSTVGPSRTGAILAGASTDARVALVRWASAVGVAFQHVDDLLGAFGDEKSTGKPAGSDLRARKKTWLFVEAVRRADDRARATLREGDVDGMRRVMVEVGAKRAVEERVAALRAEADHALDAAPIADAGRKLLRGLAARLLDRSA